MDPYAWSWNLEALVLVPLVTAAYLVAAHRTRTAWWRRAAFLLAAVLLLVVTITPVETIALHYLVWVHLLQNVVLAEWAPLLIVLGLGPVLAAALARSVPGLPALTHPLVALPLWLVNYAIWHIPVVYDTALENPHTLLHLEHLLYVLTGILFWWPVFTDAPRSLSSGARAGYVFAGFVLSAPLGLVLALVPEPVYDFYADAPERLWGLSLLTDQQLGGMTMAAEQSAVFFAVFAYWFWRFLVEQDASEDDVAMRESTS